VVPARDEVEIVHLQKIAALLVHHETSDHEGGVVFEIQDLPGIVSRLRQLLFREIEGQLLDGNRVVVRERVIEIEADRADVRETEIPVHEHAVAARDPVLAIPERLDRGILLVGSALR